MPEPVSAEMDVDPEDLVRLLLQETHIMEPPTNAERIARYLGLTVIGFNHAQFKLDNRIRAFLASEKKLIGVDRKMSWVRQTFSILHEIGHFVLPGHVTILSDDDKIVDSDISLGATTVIKQEIEANKFAADCLFQLDRFDNYSKEKDLNWRNIQAASDVYDASIEATARRWVERSDETCAMVALTPSSNQEQSPLRILYTITSSGFRNEYFAKLAVGEELDQDTLAHKYFYGLEYYDNPFDYLQVKTGDKLQEIPMHLFSNRYRLFGLLTPNQ